LNAVGLHRDGAGGFAAHLRIARHQPIDQCAELGGRAGRGGPRSETAEHHEEVPFVPPLIGCELHRHPDIPGDLETAVRDAKRGGENADHARRDAIERDRVTHETRVGPKALAPQLVADHGDGILPATVVHGIDQTPQLGTETQHPKEVARHPHRLHVHSLRGERHQARGPCDGRELLLPGAGREVDKVRH
jgi:hypothetical protein